MEINLLKNSLKSIGIAVIVALVLLLILNFVSYSNADPDKMLTPLAYVALIISTFVCGFLASRFSDDKKFICSAIAGAIYIFLIFILSAVLRSTSESTTSGWVIFVMYIVAMGSVMLGALAGQPRKVSSAKTRKNIKNKYSQSLRRKI